MPTRERGVSAPSFMHQRYDKGPGFSASRRSDRTIRRAALPIATLLLGVVALAAPPLGAPTTGQGPLAIGIDANPEGNGPLSLNTIDPCVSVSRNDVFDVDIFIRDAVELLAWETYVSYDPAILEVVDRDVKMFLAGNPGSSVLDVSGRLPDPGLYQVAAADTSDPPTPDTGSGVLFRLSMKALNSGSSSIELITRDVDGNGVTDLGPLLRNVDGDILGDTNGDAIFDGPIQNAEVVVDTGCNGDASGPTSTNSTSEDGGVNVAVIAGAAAAGTAVLLAAGFLALRRMRRPGASSG